MLIVATEDEVSEAVAYRLVAEAKGNIEKIRPFRKGGYGYLKSSLDKFCETAKRNPVIMLTDLDATTCPSKLVQNWFQKKARPQNLVFRIAVREIEAWLLADREGIAEFLRISRKKIEPNPESLDDPKRYLLTLARDAPREIRNDLLPPRGAAASQGFGYNARLREFVESDWSVTRAVNASQSLLRANARIRQCIDRL